MNHFEPEAVDFSHGQESRDDVEWQEERGVGEPAHGVARPGHH